MDQLPFLDQHERVVAAPPADVFASAQRTLTAMLASPFARLYGRVVRSHPTGRGVGLPADTLVGFRVEEAHPPNRLVLSGRHMFSSYRLVLTCDEQGVGATRVAIRTNAAFHGVHGRIYRAGLMATGAHVGVTRLVLRRIGQGATR